MTTPVSILVGSDEIVAIGATISSEPPHIPSASQREAIEASSHPVLVLAGPGAGKTFCLIERIRFLVEQRGLDPERICVFTFTNKAAGEIASRLERQLQSRAERVKRGTIHAFCAEMLREFGTQVGLEPGLNIADDEYKRSVLRRLQVPPAWHSNLLNRFAAYRFRGDELRPDDRLVYTRYQEFLDKRKMVDFDTLVLKTGQLLRDDSIGKIVRRRWDCVLVDEFQDLNPVQYGIIRELARDHRNVFAVGDDEQSIYSWAGADPEVFLSFANDFEVKTMAQLKENRRCPREIVALSRRLVTINTPIFRDRRHADSERECLFPVMAFTFPTEDAEIAWIIDDLRRDREEHGLGWGEFALLYRRHEIGDGAEASFLMAGIPCRLANGRALAEDPVVSYVIAALRVIATPDDPIHKEGFLQVVLPKPLFNAARAKSDESRQELLSYLEQLARELPREHGDSRKIWRGFYALRNLVALGARHTTLSSLVQELLSQRVGEYRTVLEEHHDELSDPAEDDDVQRLADKLAAAIEDGRTLWIPPLGGAEIAIKGILAGVGLRRVVFGAVCPEDAVSLDSAATSSLGSALAVFKAAQLARTRTFANHFRDFTAVDIESTDKDIVRSEIVEIAAVRVRDGKLAGEFHSMVKPRVKIAAGARRAHGIEDGEVATAPFFESIWPEFRSFCGSDVVVAHNGYHFDFPILRRMSESLPGDDLCTYDTLLLARELHAGSAKLVDLARVYGIDPGQSHRALDDTRTLARLFLALGEAKVARARKTALVNLLDHLGVALALSDEETLGPEAQLLRRLTRPYALGRYSECLEFYRLEREDADDPTLPTLDELIDRLGGEDLMLRIRAEKSAEQRYPAAMHRLRPLLEHLTDRPLAEQIGAFLERVVLSRSDGPDWDPARVNLLTLHSTKGLEFSRVYIVGAEDAQLPGGRDPSKRDLEEARRLLYVGMTRTKDRLVLTRVEARGGKPTGRHRFLDEMGLMPDKPKS
ncbi:MAG TPA: UvrD-helicase domain-containing protein [Gemmatimonadaceae bacterium]|nr:UvrD-helicase domain-containing protein [Gemmatimonadaceae bacterium]